MRTIDELAKQIEGLLRERGPMRAASIAQSLSASLNYVYEALRTNEPSGFVCLESMWHLPSMVADLGPFDRQQYNGPLLTVPQSGYQDSRVILSDLSDVKVIAKLGDGRSLFVVFNNDREMQVEYRTLDERDEAFDALSKLHSGS